jgi:hypothetical protein
MSLIVVGKGMSLIQLILRRLRSCGDAGIAGTIAPFMKIGQQTDPEPSLGKMNCHMCYPKGIASLPHHKRFAR